MANQFHSFTEREIKRITNNFSDMCGKGGFSFVYSGEWRDMHVAVKVTQLERAYSKPAWEKEIRMLKLFSGHPNIVRFFGHGCNKHNTQGYIVMEYLRISLDDIVTGTITDEVTKWEDLIDVIEQMAKVLKHIHQKHKSGEKRFIYVDMKAKNIMLSKDEDEGYVLKLIDLGSIVLEGETCPPYTTGCSAPEAALSKSSRNMPKGVDVKTDVYGFGMTAKTLLGTEKTTTKKEAAKDNKKDKGKSKELRKWEANHPKAVIGKLVMKTCTSQAAGEELSSLITDCTKDWKDRRPDMDQILDRLRLIKALSNC